MIGTTVGQRFSKITFFCSGDSHLERGRIAAERAS